jgi:ring-1,2-phenylacetyl-CoA epoxidase subunit PaaE
VTQFHSLVVKDICRETPDCVSIAFDVPGQLVSQFQFVAGQNVTLRIFRDGEELRRSYSICSSPLEKELRVAVKRQESGKFSSFANELLKVGDKIDVLPPSGRFILHDRNNLSAGKEPTPAPPSGRGMFNFSSNRKNDSGISAEKEPVSSLPSKSEDSNSFLEDNTKNPLPQGGAEVGVLSEAERKNSFNYLAFAAGSGITPVISIIKTILATEPKSNFTLVYGNRTRASIIFREQLEALKNRYMERFSIHHILSREETDAGLNHGRIDASKCELIAKYFVDIFSVDDIFLCGPEEMIFNVRKWLEEKGVAPERIHFELFTVPGEAAHTRQIAGGPATAETSHVKIKLDGITIAFDLPFDGDSILDGGLRQGADLPYSCKGGVCATCRAKLIKGEVEMDNNYALEEEELAAGFILTCQSHPRSAEVEVDFDAR